MVRRRNDAAESGTEPRVAGDRVEGRADETADRGEGGDTATDGRPATDHDGEGREWTAGSGAVRRVEDVDVAVVSSEAWRLLRTAAGYEQREVERELDELMQAHISMLESDTRSLSTDRLELLFELYTAELTDEQVCALVELF